MFAVFYTVNLYVLCICDLFHILLSLDTLMDPWYVCMYVCMYICIYVCLYVYLYVCSTWTLHLPLYFAPAPLSLCHSFFLVEDILLRLKYNNKIYINSVKHNNFFIALVATNAIKHCCV